MEEAKADFEAKLEAERAEEEKARAEEEEGSGDEKKPEEEKEVPRFDEEGFLAKFNEENPEVIVPPDVIEDIDNDWDVPDDENAGE